nr:PF20097 family protein [Jeotgalibaca dankookensis]
MVKGYIYGDRYALKWLAEDEKLLAGTWLLGGIPLKRNTKFARPKIENFMCNTYEILTTDLKTQKA